MTHCTVHRLAAPAAIESPAAFEDFLFAGRRPFAGDPREIGNLLLTHAAALTDLLASVQMDEADAKAAKRETEVSVMNPHVLPTVLDALRTTQALAAYFVSRA